MNSIDIEFAATECRSSWETSRKKCVSVVGVEIDEIIDAIGVDRILSRLTIKELKAHLKERNFKWRNGKQAGSGEVVITTD